MSCVIFGAGKIARGFIGHLLFLSRIDFTFVEKLHSLAELINERGQYGVNVLGNPDANCLVTGAKALKFSDEREIAAAVAGADCVFTAIGGKNLAGIAQLLCKGIEAKAQRGGTLNIVACENWKQPAEALRDAVRGLISPGARAFLAEHVGFTEAVVMRSAIEAGPDQVTADPLVVNVQDYWRLPVDASRVVGALPPMRGLEPIPEFSGFLERKFYTYNAANGTVSYLGALLGYEKIADAAHDERILAILDGVYGETARALSTKHRFPLDEQLAFALSSKRKLQDETIVDFIERNARDPIRKLGPDDRLVGSARLALDQGIMPENLCIAIAAAIHYAHDGDESARELARMREEEGIDAVLTKVCGIEADGRLGKMVREKIDLLKKWGWIR